MKIDISSTTFVDDVKHKFVSIKVYTCTKYSTLAFHNFEFWIRQIDKLCMLPISIGISPATFVNFTIPKKCNYIITQLKHAVHSYSTSFNFVHLK